MEKHELFEQLDAFDPQWQEHYHTLYLAAKAAGEEDLFRDFLTTPEGARYRLAYEGVPDTLKAVEKMQEQEANSALPYKLNRIGNVPGGRG